MSDEDERSQPSWRVRLDKDRCIGSGLCVSRLPTHFRFAGTGSEATVEETVPSDEVIAAADSCPAEAITVADLADGRVLAP
jgi:ferredoxin